MDYDQTRVPEAYDAGRDVSVSEKNALIAFFVENVNAAAVTDILDLGCGTGRFSQTLSDTFDANVIGIDPSQKMLDQARSKVANARLTFKQAPGEALPLNSDSVDLVFMSMVLHHLTDPQKTAHECDRVLRPGGHVCIRTTTTDEITSYPYLDVFPSIRAIIDEGLMPRSALTAMFKAAGFKLAAHQSSWHQIGANWQAFADNIALKADSFVARLPEDEFQSGVAALRTKAAKADASEPVGLNMDQFIFRRL